jgi:hypothetical protein
MHNGDARDDGGKAHHLASGDMMTGWSVMKVGLTNVGSRK